MPIHGFWDTGHTWATDGVKCALLKSTASPSQATDFLWSDVSADEVSGTGYSSGGVALASKTSTFSTSRLAWVFDAADVTFSSVTLTDVRYAVLYWTADNKILGIYQFQEPVATTATDIVLQFADNGVWEASLFNG